MSGLAQEHETSASERADELERPFMHAYALAGPRLAWSHRLYRLSTAGFWAAALTFWFLPNKLPVWLVAAASLAAFLLGKLHERRGRELVDGARNAFIARSGAEPSKELIRRAAAYAARLPGGR